VRLISALLFLVSLCVGSSAAAQQLQLSVDRTELARGETLTLTIRVFDQRQGMQLDLTPLTEQFDVLGTRTSSQIRSVNGAVESWTDYIVTLFPLEEGQLSIPALTINNQTTDPIEIVVSNQGPRSNQSNEELYLEIETNKDSVYVQEQLLFTVRLYYTINGIRNPQFTELEMPNSVIQLIGSPNQYEKLIDGVRYGVYEKRYVIFPQRSGPLEIPDMLFRGEVTDGSSNFVFRNLNTRRVTAFIEGTTIEVKQRPASVQADSMWLPVTNLRLEEAWDPPLAEMQIGDTVTRTVTMVADGLDGAVLPPFTASTIAGANVYPDPPTIERTFVDGSIVGTRSESMSIVPTASGELVIPQISVPWWNVETDEAEVSIVPATRIQVAALAGAAPSEQTVASSGDLARLLAAAPTVDQDMIDAQNEAEFIEVNSLWLNLAIVLALLVVAASVYQLVIVQHRKEINRYFADVRARRAARIDPANNERIAFKRLKQACQSNDLNRIRAALIQWCEHFIAERSIRSMEDILQQQQTPALVAPARAILTALYNNAGGTSQAGFDGPGLFRLVERLRHERQHVTREQRRDQEYALPPLYKTL
jgi:hypothetical protein